MKRSVVGWWLTVACVAGIVGLGSVLSRAEEISATATIDSMVWDCRVDGNRAVTRIYEKVMVMKPAGAGFASVGIWSSPLISLNSFNARMLDASGKVVFKYGKGDLLKICGFGEGFEVYTDECLNSLDFAYPKYPYTIETSWEEEFKSLYLLGSVDLDREIPVRTAMVRLSFPVNQHIRYRQYQLPGEPEILEKGGERVVTWRFADLPPVKDIAYTPPESKNGRHIALAAEEFALEKFSFAGLTWKNVGLFQRKLGEDPDSLSGPAATAPASAVEARRIADSLYRDVIDNTRYVAASVGIGGWQPHRLAYIKQRLYGDCKDLTALLVSKLRTNGITAYPCLLLTNDQGATDTSFVNFWFNHVITMAMIGNDTVWYDPTCTHCPPGQMRSDDDGVVAVVATDTGGVLARVPLSEPQSSRIVRRIEVTADSAGRLSLKVHAAASGHFATSLRGSIEHKDKKELDQYMSDWLIGSRAQLKVTNYSLANIDDITKPVQIDYTVACSQPMDMINRTRYFLPFFLTSRNVYGEVETEKRETDIWLGFKWELCDTIIVRGSLLNSAGQVTTPQDTVFSYPWARVAANYAATDSVITAALTVTYTADVVPVAALGDFKSFVGRRRWLVDQPIKFMPK
ncbi:hypothetical protein C3F09_06685 [candidate division GN15 bacterium]|uniref:DUF3857 domain-containing protein n=1 Tax=candidate division GN15 bacterium TaxID=2072418 RepID=A0A855X0L2_9BACT|nr:MAG: hypothetical protein C3F09_06685 [candidate division GN15 bacterium]